MYCQSRRQAIPNQVMLLPWSTIKFSLLHSLEEICQSVRGTAIFLLGLIEVLHLLKSSKSAWCSAQLFHFSWLFNVLLKTVLHSYYESKAGCIVASLPQMNHDNTTTLLWTKQKVDYFLIWKSRWSVWPWQPPPTERVLKSWTAIFFINLPHLYDYWRFLVAYMTKASTNWQRKSPNYNLDD